MKELTSEELFHKVAKSIDDALGLPSGAVGAKLIISAAYSSADLAGFSGLFSLEELSNGGLKSIKSLLDYPLGFSNQEVYIDEDQTRLYKNGIVSLTYRAKKTE